MILFLPAHLKWSAHRSKPEGLSSGYKTTGLKFCMIFRPE